MWATSFRILLPNASRNGRNFLDRFPLIAASIAKLPIRSCLIDGEAIVTDGCALSTVGPLAAL